MTDNRVFTDEMSTPDGLHITIDPYVLDSVFTYVPSGVVPDHHAMGAGETYDAYWYAPVKSGVDGWVILWEDGNSHHTYHDPGELYR